MQFTTTAALALLSAAITSSAAPLIPRTNSTTTCPVTQEGDYVWKISEFFSRQPNGIGKGISALGFNVKATNGGTLDFNCSSSTAVEDNKFYSCGETSFISFAWSSDRNGLVIKQHVSHESVTPGWSDAWFNANGVIVSHILVPRRSLATAALAVLEPRTLCAMAFRMRILRLSHIPRLRGMSSPWLCTISGGQRAA
jgi:hypothetical protein